MDLAALRRLRRLLSAVVSLSAIALVMAKVGATAERGEGVGTLASFALLGSLGLLVLVWRKEHAANEAAFAERERQQLAAFKLLLNTQKMQQEDGKAGRSDRSAL